MEEFSSTVLPTPSPYLLKKLKLMQQKQTTQEQNSQSQTKTNGQSNLTTGCIPAAHGRFNGIWLVARVCIPS